ncbi:DUF2871 family protein [Malacoplasma iowae]|uniref:DUF2871 family protein n=1 Tax=Malacoplasma iowae TaxID=2116 RepID=UPI0038736E05|nr:DUF2871 family protein [Malacoplasma iowae]
MKKDNNKKAFFTSPMIILLIISISWLVIGLLLGIFYDFFFLFGGKGTFDTTTGTLTGYYKVFNEKIFVFKFMGIFTQLSVLHTHALVLGFIVNLVFLILEKLFTISYKKRFFISSIVLYNIGLLLLLIFMLIRGIDAVFGIEYIKTQINNGVNNTNGPWTFVITNKNPYKSLSSSLTAIPHIIIAVGLIHMLVCIYKSVKKFVQNKKENSNNNLTIS